LKALSRCIFFPILRSLADLALRYGWTDRQPCAFKPVLKYTLHTEIFIALDGANNLELLQLSLFFFYLRNNE
jgi:hypothetical protein